MASYDALIVGAGPAGSTAAYFLARSGASVCVLEKKSFPRAKTCGDGLTPRAVTVLDEIGMEDSTLGYKRVNGLRVHSRGRWMEMGFPKASHLPLHGFIRARKDLDSEIAARAQDAGAEFLMGVEASEGLFEEGGLTGVRWVRKAHDPGGGVVVTDVGEVRATFTLIADGAQSPFGRALGLQRREDYPMGLAIRTYYRSPRGDDDLLESWLELRSEDELLPGYGWVFPMGDGIVNVGVGLLNTYGGWRNVNLNRLQRAYVDMLPKSYGINHETQTEPYKSGRLPMGGGLFPAIGQGFLIIGDAAGYINPFNGEGIAYALETGKLAAGCVIDALRNGRSSRVVEYPEALHDTYGAYYRAGRKFVRILGRPWAFTAMCQVGMRSQGLMELVFKILGNMGERSGGSFGDRLFRRLVRLAEFDLPELKDPQITPPTAKAVAS